MQPFDSIVSLNRRDFAFRNEAVPQCAYRGEKYVCNAYPLKADNDIRYFLDRDASPRQTIWKL